MAGDDAAQHVREIGLWIHPTQFAGLDQRGDDCPVLAAAMTTLIASAKLNDVDPLAWLADVLARIAGMRQSQLPELRHWKALQDRQAAA